MNMLILFSNNTDVNQSEDSHISQVFKQSIDKVTSSFNLDIIPVIYLVFQNGPFMDETERLENIFGLNRNAMQLPQIGLIHGVTKNHVPYPHVIMDEYEFTPDIVGYWAVFEILKADRAYKLEKT